MGRADRRNDLENRLWVLLKRFEEIPIDRLDRLADITVRLEKAVVRIENVLMHFDEIAIMRKDRKELRAQVLELHKLLQEEVKDMVPKLSGGPNRETKLR